MRRLLTLAALALLPLPAWAASERIAGALETGLQPPAITTHQITQYLARRTPTPPVPWTSADWGAEARRLRRRLLEDIVLHGWPREWVSAPPRIEDLGVVASTPAYRVRKLRYEIVPATARRRSSASPPRWRSRCPGCSTSSGTRRMARRSPTRSTGAWRSPSWEWWRLPRSGQASARSPTPTTPTTSRRTSTWSAPTE